MKRVAILANEHRKDHELWVRACNQFSDRIISRVISLTGDNWLNEIREFNPDLCFTKPGGLTGKFKQLYDERVYILERVLGFELYPNAEEVFIYENKRFLSFWLEANGIPHPATNVFYTPEEAIVFIDRTSFPLVGKTNIGASGSGVSILSCRSEAYSYIKKTFRGKGASERVGPNLRSGNLLKRAINNLLSPRSFLNRISVYMTRSRNRQTGFVIFQEFIQHEFEWRVVRVGDSFFAHKKIKSGTKASGSLLKEYCNPPMALLDFVKKITDKHGFYSQAVDLFEHKGVYLVNEMQCIFGQSDPYQMLVNGKEGRYINTDGIWIFEEGGFCENECYNLRVAWKAGQQ